MATLFIIAKIWKQPTYLSTDTDEWINKIHTHTHTHIYIYIYIHTHTHIYTHAHKQWNIIQPCEEGNPVICDNMDGPQAYYSYIEGQTLYVLICGIKKQDKFSRIRK